MEQKEIIEGNKLIAEFMGYRMKAHVQGYAGTFYYLNGKRWRQPEMLEYHSSWDHLMPVVEKINQSNKYDIIIFKSTVQVNDPMEMIIETTSEEYGSLLLAVFGAVLQFIQFYNALNNPSKDKADGK